MPPMLLREMSYKRKVKVNGNIHLAIVVPKIFIDPILYNGHTMLGHNGFNRTYAAIHHLYYWKGMKASVEKYIRTCHKCQQRNQQVVHFKQGNFEVASFPMEFISMDLIGEFHPPSKSGYKYALMVICRWQACISKHVSS